MIAFSLFLCSLLFLLCIARARAVETISLYWVFVSFQCLYNLAPWVTSYLDVPVLSLLSDHAVIDTQLILSAISNGCFGIVYWAFYRKPPLAPPRNESIGLSRSNFYSSAAKTITTQPRSVGWRGEVAANRAAPRANH